MGMQTLHRGALEMSNNEPDYKDNLFFEPKPSGTLTEQWKKGELPTGWYYIKIVDIIFIDFFEGKEWKNKKDIYISEVLAPVPSYEEWGKAYERVVSENEAIITLKELLKECRDIMYHSLFLGDKTTEKMINVRKKIDEVLK